MEFSFSGNLGFWNICLFAVIWAWVDLEIPSTDLSLKGDLMRIFD